MSWVFLCGQDAPKESNTLNTRGHNVAKNVLQVSPEAVLSKLGAAMSSFPLGGLNKDLIVLAILTFVEIHHLEAFPSLPTSHPMDT